MEITYNWIIGNMDCYTIFNEKNNVVSLIRWQLQATTGSYMACEFGMSSISFTTGSTFIPYENLTKEIIAGWLENEIGIENLNSLKISLQNSIQEQINPTIVSLLPPWN